MTIMIKAVLFDIDGTILDTLDFVFLAVKYTLDKHEFIVSKELLMQAAGRPLLEYYRFILPNEDYEQLAQTHREFQKDKHITMVKTFPNVKKVLKKLRKENYKMAGVSNRSRESLVESLKVTGIEDYFDVIVGVGDVENPKPHKDHPNKALELLGVDKDFAIMVGDTAADIKAGKSAGIKTVGVTYGWIGKDIKKSKPDFVIDNIEELLDLV